MPRIPRHARAVVVVASLLALVLVGCRREAADTDADETTEPSATPSVEVAGEFQLVGRSEQAFLGITPGVDTSGRSGRDRPETPEGFQKPPDTGVMRVELETFTDDLRDRCDADPEDLINVYWTRNTDFSPLLLRGSLETTLEARTVGVIGSIFRLPALEIEDGIGLGGESPAASPAATPSVDERCVLVADQIGTERPQARATARPATPAPTPAATAEPTPTSTPEESPEASPEETPEETP